MITKKRSINEELKIETLIPNRKGNKGSRLATPSTHHYQLAKEL